ncbi:MAG: cell surface protein SprA, partial [Olleya sp.]
PNIDTDAPSNISVRGDFAYLLPGAPKGTDFNGEATAYIDDFEGTQNGIDLKSAQAWNLSSRPLAVNGVTTLDDNGIENGYGRAMLNWYTIDPIFYGSQRPGGISDDDMSSLYTSRVFVNELFPEQDIAQGQTSVLNTLDLTYYPDERGPYNFEPGTENGTIANPQDSWAGITRQITSTDFEQANVEYIEFWLQDPFQENPSNPGGKLYINLGNISEDVLKDGRKQYENGLPQDGNVSLLPQTVFQSVVPQNQALIYAFDTTGQERTNQDVGFDGYDDGEEATNFPSGFAGLTDPAKDNYDYYLNAEGSLFERYKLYNGVDGNSPDAFSDTNRGSTTQPDVEDVNRDNTMNTIDSYFEYEVEITPATLNINNEYIVDTKNVTDNNNPRVLPNGDTAFPKWYQFRIPIRTDNEFVVNGITDLRSIRFTRLYLNDFQQNTTLRFGTLELVRSDWRRFQLALDGGPTPLDFDDTAFTVGAVSTQENDGSYVSPPSVVPERLNNNNTIVRQNEQSLVVDVCDLKAKDARAVFKNINVDMRQYKKLRMFIHARDGETPGLEDNDLVGFIRMGNDLTQNYYQIEVPLQVYTGGSTAEAYWPAANEINLDLEILQRIKSLGITNQTLTDGTANFYDVVGNDLVPVVDPFGGYITGQQRVAIKGNPNFGDVRTLMVGVKNGSNFVQCGEIWFNELRLSELENEGGWAAIVTVDTQLADFASVSATGRMSTAGFGSVNQGPSERSLEDSKQYDVITNVNVGQLLPKKWGIQIPFNYGQGVEVITPKFDQQYEDIELDTRLDEAENDLERDQILELSEEYTKRKSINFIGVKKNRTGDSKPRFYDVENLTLNYSYNKMEHRDFEIERSVDKQVRAGVNYAYNFEPKIIEPFKKNDSLFTGKYWKFLKELNFNVLPSSFTINSDLNRQFNRQKFRDLDLTGNNIGLEELYRRNYTFDYQYNLNWSLTKSLQVNYSSSNNNIVRNYFKDNIINGEPDPLLDVWDGFFDFGDPNRQQQQIGINYELPLNKIPTLSFLQATYSYSGLFQWQKGSDLFGNLVGNDGNTYNLGNTISNGNTHNINSTLDMNKLYKYLGISTKTRSRGNKVARGSRNNAPPTAAKKKEELAKKKGDGIGSKIGNFGVGLLTSVKRIQAVYS